MPIETKIDTAKLESVIRSHLPNYRPDQSLRDLADSISIISILTDLERASGKKIDLMALDPKNLKTLAAIAAYFESLK